MTKWHGSVRVCHYHYLYLWIPSRKTNGYKISIKERVTEINSRNINALSFLPLLLRHQLYQPLCIKWMIEWMMEWMNQGIKERRNEWTVFVLFHSLSLHLDLSFSSLLSSNIIDLIIIFYTITVLINGLTSRPTLLHFG